MMDENRAREIWLDTELDNYPNKYSASELKECDNWLRDYTLARLDLMLTRDILSPALRRFVVMCVRAGWGSSEVDELLNHYDCYPSWVRPNPEID